MNYFKLIYGLVIALFFIILTSCEKEEPVSSGTAITSEINKIESAYQKGIVKFETTAEEGFQKKETSANEDFKEQLRLELEKSYNKQRTYLKSASSVVGVIKNGSCGGYNELYWHMDCEDSNNQSSKSGWFGDCNVNSSGNIVFHICIVDGDFFERTNVDYAVLNFTGSSNWPFGVNSVIAFIDNEDANNYNSSSESDIEQFGWLGNCDFYSNTRLGFYYYPHQNGSRYFPSLGFSYGVFGQFGSNQGNIYSDDEDNNNSNFISRIDYNTTTNKLNNPYLVSSVSGVIQAVGNNTRLYASKVN
jgi:hypothetical protein